MKREELTEIGKIKRPHGLQGHIKVVFDDFYINFLENFTALIIEKGDDYLPFFVEQLDSNAQPAILKFESANSKEDASKLIGKTIFALNSQLPVIKENQLNLVDGLEVFDENNTPLGIIEEVMELPSQLILKVIKNDNELLIPFHEDFIIEIIPEENRIQLELPEGLLDIYS